ncbi:hypothetical protein ABIE49_007671 [Bradyrhizobium sp. OAE829]
MGRPLAVTDVTQQVRAVANSKWEPPTAPTGQKESRHEAAFPYSGIAAR